ncbi:MULTISPECIES: hypothetical protein [Mastigocoleus]|nr:MULTISPECIES: hypothetical protein [Mastigocoleus]
MIADLINGLGNKDAVQTVTAPTSKKYRLFILEHLAAKLLAAQVLK